MKVCFLKFMLAMSIPATASAAHTHLQLGSPRAFAWGEFVESARQSAKTDYKPSAQPSPELVSRLGYDQANNIRFRGEHSLFAEDNGGFPVSFFHLRSLAPKTVKMHVIDDGRAREIQYSPSYFEMPADSVALKLPKDTGFAGFQIKNPKTKNGKVEGDWAAFMGASYFRALNGLRQYGLSARGIALNIDTYPQPEEFPDFTEFYFERAADDLSPITVYARLEGPSVTGAYRFLISRDVKGDTIMEITAAVFLRKDVERLGLAPLTSMYWFSNYDKALNVDWRPKVHDTDGLALLTGAGERIWRPLNNPRRVRTNGFLDRNPKGFGLLQRDRDPSHYLDAAFYERRPSLWVEPLGSWGEGSVQLTEIPTADETNDNIVAMWVPAKPARAGQEYIYSYRLHWTAGDPEFAEGYGRVAATYRGPGGNPGLPRPERTVKYVLDFEPVRAPAPGESFEPVISGENTKVVYMGQAPGSTHWRLDLEVGYPTDEPVNPRVYLKDSRGRVTETWNGQLDPEALR